MCGLLEEIFEGITVNSYERLIRVKTYELFGQQNVFEISGEDLDAENLVV